MQPLQPPTHMPARPPRRTVRTDPHALVRARATCWPAAGRESDYYSSTCARPRSIRRARPDVGRTDRGRARRLTVETRRRALRRRDADCDGGRIASHRRGARHAGLLRAQEAQGSRRQEDDRGLPKGETLEGRKSSMVEDVTTTGGSSMQASKAARGRRQHRVRADDRRPARRARREDNSPPTEGAGSSGRSRRRMSF